VKILTRARGKTKKASSGRARLKQPPETGRGEFIIKSKLKLKLTKKSAAVIRQRSLTSSQKPIV
jgi:hypothetical protein